MDNQDNVSKTDSFFEREVGDLLLNATSFREIAKILTLHPDAIDFRREYRHLSFLDIAEYFVGRYEAAIDPEELEYITKMLREEKKKRRM